MIGMTAVLGYLAINVPAGIGFGNLPFVAIMVGLTIVAVVANVAHPLRWSLDEIRFAIGAPVVIGVILALAAIATGRAFTSLTIRSLTVTPLELALAVAGDRRRRVGRDGARRSCRLRPAGARSVA